MGLVGLFATVAIMAVASWYMLAGPSSPSVVMDNTDTVPTTVESTGTVVPENTNTVSGAQALIGQAKDLKATLEQQAAETSQQITDNSEQGTTNKEQSDGSNQQPVTGNQEKTGAGDIKIINQRVDFGFSVPERPRKIDTVVLHSSYDALGSEPYSVAGTIKEYGEYGVAPHYLIDRKGNIYRLADDKNIAYHAGESRMKDGRTGVNDFSIGIELLNKEDDRYTDAQYAAVNSLVAYLKDLYPIKYVVGHDDIAPGRKTDPWNFDWKKVQ